MKKKRSFIGEVVLVFLIFVVFVVLGLFFGGARLGIEVLRNLLIGGFAALVFRLILLFVGRTPIGSKLKMFRG